MSTVHRRRRKVRKQRVKSNPGFALTRLESCVIFFFFFIDDFHFGLSHCDISVFASGYKEAGRRGGASSAGVFPGSSERVWERT